MDLAVILWPALCQPLLSFNYHTDKCLEMALMLELDYFLTFLQLGKSFGAQLRAKDDNLSDEAIAEMAALAKPWSFIGADLW